MEPRPAERLMVRVDLLSDPCLWRWEIVDTDGALVESSWATDWTGYASAEEAWQAGMLRLTTRRDPATGGGTARAALR